LTNCLGSLVSSLTFVTLYRSLLASFQCPPNQIDSPPETTIWPSTVYGVFKICGVSVIHSFPEKNARVIS